MRRLFYAMGLLLLCGRAVAAEADLPAVKDFTKGDKPDSRAQASFLHLNGTVMGIPNEGGDKIKDSTQIYISAVKESPYMESILKVGDVLLGVDGKLFEGYAVKTLRSAVAEAKLRGRAGSIKLTFWRDGTQRTVDVLALPPPPDITRGDKMDSTPGWNLGPTGAKGWIFSRGLDTSESRQIVVTEIEKDSPASGVLALQDVIVGVNGKRFDGDALRAFGEAITEAEKEENKGLLKLLCWRAGSQIDVSIQIKVMGRYSDSAPYKCAKSSLIVEQGCRNILKRGIGGGIVGDLNALALMASGNPEYRDVVREHARKVGKPGLKLEMKEGMFLSLIHI